MYTDVTYQDWELTPEHERLELLLDIIRQYKSSPEFRQGIVANQYFRSENPVVAGKYLLRPTVVEIRDEGTGKVKKTNRTERIDGNRVFSSFFSRFVIQQNQFLLANGVTLKDEAIKKRLGIGFDKTLERLGEKALVHGVAWGFWNVDHLEVIEAVKDKLSGAVALVDERTSEPKLLVQFWQVGRKRPLYARLYALDGVVEYMTNKDGKLVEIAKSRRAYVQHTSTDMLGTQIIGESNYSSLPVIPLWASEEKRSELTPAIKSKIDLYDRILSDFGDNLDRACDVYWVLNNFGGTMSDIAETLAAIEKLKAVANISDGTGSASTAEPHTIEVPYAARQAALEILQKQLYSDYMALSMDELTGGSLTNVAIETAMLNLNLKADRYEWQCFAFVQKVLRLLGIDTEEITFKRQELVNRSEIVNDLSLMRDYIDQETALKKNPYILQEEVQGILDRLAAESMSAAPEVKKPDNADELDEEEDDA